MEKSDDKKTKSFLPISRRKQISFFLKTNIGLLFRLSLLLFCFALPAFLTMFIYLTLEGSIMRQHSLDPSAQWINVMAFRRMMGLSIIPCSLIFSIGVSGASRILRLLLFNEGVFLREDFWIGIKRNWANNLGKAFLSSMVCYALYSSLTFFGPTAVWHYLFFYILVGVLFVLIITANFYFVFLNDLYSDGFIKKLGASYALSLKDPLGFILTASLSALPITVLFYADGISFLATAIALVLFTLFFPLIGFSIAGLLAATSAAKVADEVINKKYFPAYFRKGLFNGDSIK